MIELHPTVMTDRVVQHLFPVEFESDGKTFEFHIYAVDFAHAVMIVQDIKGTSKAINRKLEGVYQDE
jgi:hypothetical protein